MNRAAVVAAAAASVLVLALSACTGSSGSSETGALDPTTSVSTTPTSVPTVQCRLIFEVLKGITDQYNAISPSDTSHDAIEHGVELIGQSRQVTDATFSQCSSADDWRTAAKQTEALSYTDNATLNNDIKNICERLGSDVPVCRPEQ